MDWYLVVMFVVSLVVVLCVSVRMLKILEEISNSRWRNCEFTISEDQFLDLMSILEEMSRENKRD